jgi:hypothetical protein
MKDKDGTLKKDTNGKPQVDISHEDGRDDHSKHDERVKHNRKKSHEVKQWMPPELDPNY